MAGYVYVIILVIINKHKQQVSTFTMCCNYAKVMCIIYICVCVCVYMFFINFYPLTQPQPFDKGRKQNYILLVLGRYGNIATKGTLPNTSSELFGSFFQQAQTMRFQIRLTPHKLLHLSKTNLIPLHECCYIRHMPYHNWCPFRVVDARGCQKGHLKAYPSHSGQKGLTFFMARNSPLDIFGCYTFNER